MMSIVQDIRYGLRALHRSPGFTLTAVLSISIAIAGNAAVFSIADALLFRARPGIAAPDRLIDVGRTDLDGDFDTLSYPDYVEYRERNTVFAGLAAHGREVFGLSIDQNAIRADGGRVSANYFSVLGVPIVLGRSFLSEEERVGAMNVAVISEGVWRREFNTNADVIGRVVRLNGTPFTIIGVAGGGFAGNMVVPQAIWVPIGAYPTDSARLNRREGSWLDSIGRLKHGVTIDQARAQMEQIARQLEREHPETNRGMGVALVPSHRIPVSEQEAVAIFLSLLFGMVLSIFLIASTNVGGMLLARAVTRGREIAIRLALGARRLRIVSLLVTEAVILGFAGALIGSLGAVALTQVLRGVLPVLPIPVALDFRVDWRVVTFSIALSIIAACVFGLIPALQMGRSDLSAVVRTDGASQGTHRLRMRQLFVVAQVAMSVLLVVCALLLARSVRNANSIDPGFVADGVDMVGIDMQLGGYDAARGAEFSQQLISRVEQLPGVGAASTTWIVPLRLRGTSVRIWLPGQASENPAVITDWNVITPRYFDVVRMPIRRGRSFNTSDSVGAPDVVVINETLARRVWPGEDPVGRTLMYGEDRKTAQIVGIVRDAKYRSLGETPRPFLYAPLAQNYQSELWLLLRRSGPTVLPAVRTLVRDADPNLPIVQETTLADATAFSLFPQRLAAGIAGGVGFSGILLASLGLYGITAYNVTRRTREIGVRIALGALPIQVLRLILRQSMLLVSSGAVIGLLLAGFATQLLRDLLYGVEPLDAFSFLAGAILFGSVAVMAAWFAARRAARLNPLVALRHE